MVVKTTSTERANAAGQKPLTRGRSTRRTQLRDGTPIVVRPLLPDDEPKLDAIVSQLSPLSRYFRYLTPLDHLPERARRELCAADGRDHLALIAEIEEDGAERPVGVARSVRVGPGARVAEVAVEVVDEWHRCGVGTLLLTVLAAWSVDLGIDRWHAVRSVQNVGIQKVLAAVADLVSERYVGYGLVEAMYELHTV